MEFVDRLLKCSDCGSDFVFTSGEQLFFLDRQFTNDPKRCKLCKAKRAGLERAESGPSAVAILPLSRTETRTECSACGVDTTVPFKPTQGRPVFCRSCFQVKRLPGIQEHPATLQADSSTVTMAAIAETPAAALAAVQLPAGMELPARGDMQSMLPGAHSMTEMRKVP